MRKTYLNSIDLGRPAHLGGGSWTLSDLTPITVLFGKNGSGKSLLMRAWRDTDRTSLHYVVPERSGTLDFEPGYFRQQLTGQERGSLTTRNYLTEYRQHVVSRVQSYFSARGNVRGVALPGNPEDLERLISQLLPDFTIELDGLASPPYRLKRAADEGNITSIDQLSSGEAQLLTIGLDVVTMGAIWEIERRASRTVLIDEPDAHIHPDLQVRFADFLIQVADKFSLQVVVATHSTSFLAALGQFGGGDVGVVYFDRVKSVFKSQPFTKITQELSACLGGHALMGPLFGVPLLLVEGDDDYRIWSQVPRHHVVSLSVIPCHGDEIKKYQRSLEQMFAALREEGSPLSGYALIDADKGKPRADQHTPQKHIRYIQLSCHETENLYLTDEVLGLLGLDWAAARLRIIDRAGEFGGKEAFLRTVDTWDRKTEDIKGVIAELERILDDKNVHWTIRTAQAIGRVRPSGQLADFLGEEVTTALWGVEAEVVPEVAQEQARAN